jgi:hypothetical protein
LEFLLLASIQGTKWYGQDVWTTEGCTSLHSGRSVPNDNQVHLRGEGVGIFLDETASVAWNLGGEFWKAVSSRTVTARLKFHSMINSTKNCRKRRKYADVLFQLFLFMPPHSRHHQQEKRSFMSSCNSLWIMWINLTIFFW